jgi:DNA polymerase III subunit epsilon
MESNFVAIDVETANVDLPRICQVGVSSFWNGKPQDQWKSLVNPEDYFDEINVSIHGIDEEAVRSAPNWAKVHAQVNSRLNGEIVVSHIAFDRVALYRACEKNKLPICECRWLDSAKVVRRAWPKFAKSGYGLANVAKELGINYMPHDRVVFGEN